MNKLKLTMGTLLLSAAVVSCNTAGDVDKKSTGNIYDLPDIEIKDGKITPEVLEALGRVSEAVASPDGTMVAFTVGHENIEENSSASDIYLVNMDGSNVRRLTRTSAGESNLRWIDGGKRLAFITKDNHTKKAQVHSITPTGSDKRCLSQMEGGVTCFEISPDGTKIVMGSMIDSVDRDSVIFNGLDKTTGRLVNDLMYKHWDEWITSIPHPFLADFSLNKGVQNATDIMEGEPYECPMLPFGGAETFAWAPDSKSLIYTSRKLVGQEYAFSTDSDLFLYTLDTKKTENITGDEMQGYDTNPHFSPDGKYLAWMSMENPGCESDKNRIMVMDMATRQMRDITKDWDYSAESISWTPDGKRIIFNAYYQGCCPIFSINTATCAIDTLADGQCDYAGVQPVGNDALLALCHSMQRPNEVFYIKDKQPKAITDVNGDIYAKLKPGKVEKKIITTKDNKQMTCWVIYPSDFDPNKKYPALLYCQGGPQQAVSQFWSYRWNFMIMAANGYIVIAPNRHGLPGFGTEWNAQISGDYGGENMRDYLSAVDYIREQPYVDRDHIGAAGASYGGFSVYWLAGHHEGRFAALVAHAGIFNLEAQYLETEEMWFAKHDMGGAPWNTANATAQATFATSPHKYVDQWTAPILVTVGELDYRILASQGMMAFNAAKMHGLDAEMLVFPDENHWILKPQNAVLWQRVFFNFLDSYLKPDSPLYQARIKAAKKVSVDRDGQVIKGNAPAPADTTNVK